MSKEIDLKEKEIYFWGDAEVEINHPTKDEKERKEIQEAFTKFLERLGLKVQKITWRDKK